MFLTVYYSFLLIVITSYYFYLVTLWSWSYFYYLMYMRILRILGAHIYILFIPSHYFGTLRLVAPFQVQTLHRYLHIPTSWTFYQASEYLHLPWVQSRGWIRVEAPRKLRGSWVDSTRLLRRGLVWDVWGCSDDFYLHFCCSSPVSQRGTWLNLCLFRY